MSSSCGVKTIALRTYSILSRLLWDKVFLNVALLESDSLENFLLLCSLWWYLPFGRHRLEVFDYTSHVTPDNWIFSWALQSSWWRFHGSRVSGGPHDYFRWRMEVAFWVSSQVFCLLNSSWIMKSSFLITLDSISSNLKVAWWLM